MDLTEAGLRERVQEWRAQMWQEGCILSPPDGTPGIVERLLTRDIALRDAARAEQRDAALEEAATIADEHCPEYGHTPLNHPGLEDAHAISCSLSIAVLIRRLIGVNGENIVDRARREQREQDAKIADEASRRYRAQSPALVGGYAAFDVLAAAIRAQGGEK